MALLMILAKVRIVDSPRELVYACPQIYRMMRGLKSLLRKR